MRLAMKYTIETYNVGLYKEYDVAKKKMVWNCIKDMEYFFCDGLTLKEIEDKSKEYK